MKKAVFILHILTFCFISTKVAAQPISKSTYSTMVQTAEEAFAKRDYYNALDWYQKAYDENRTDELVAALAEVHYELRDYKKADNYFKRAFRLKKGKEPVIDPKIRFKYARTLKMNGNYDEAAVHLQKLVDEATDEKLKELAQYELTGTEMAKVMRPVPRLRVENAGDKVNTTFSEYSAFISPTGKEMYFASFNRKDVLILDGKEENAYAKIFKSVKNTEGQWDKPVALDEKINRPEFHTSNVCLSPDGRRMYFTRQLLEGNVLSESKVFYIENTGGDSWGPANEIGGINGKYLARHPSVGELFGNEVLFFSSDMDGGQGGFDLYYATYKGNGMYADPVNLGPKINTPGDEETPFYREGILYFSSTGHPGIGGYDIFSSVWNGTTWSEPKNMGLGYNTPLDDKYFMIDKSGYSGFIVSNREGTKSTVSKTCCDDIWAFSIEKLEIDAIVGTFDGESGDPLFGAKVQLFELTDNQLTAVDEQSNPTGNVFNFPLLSNKAYRLIAVREGYYPDSSKVFNTVGITESKKMEFRLRLRPEPPKPEFEEIEVSINEAIRLNNIYYDFDDDKILPSSETDLQVLLDLMNQYPNIKIELSSHTDARGNDEYNQNLSQRRAESARNWLLGKGISANRIVPKGYGESQILNQCVNGVKCTDEEHRFNRRTEFKITEGPTTVTIKKTEKRLKSDPKITPKPEPPKPAPKQTVPDKKKIDNPGIKRREE
jgi:peptidoglycan-associated lipoprotein